MTETATPAPTAPAASPFGLFALRVARSTRLTPNMVRVALTGPDLSRMASAGRDQRIKLFLPAPGRTAPDLPDNSDGQWYAAWQALDPATRGYMRTYTIRTLDTERAELTVDFAVHGEEGPASRWALHARPGDEVGAFAPVVEDNAAYEFRPPADADWILLAADASALPAVAGILEHLPPAVPVRAWIEVPGPADHQNLPAGLDTHITWLTTAGSTPEAIAAADLPSGTPYAWVAGESSTVKAVRRHLVQGRGIDRRRVQFSGYWRKGASEDLLMEKNEAA
ncbi:SIP domain-containing protein [Streptomyces sp. SID5785]|uniref:siderophore-interacting protein n=1 Tax=Streptomyces sp. SID5785 TaxID=2690309 RepID=UPI0013616BBE|nr:siderophore-interacting protein [Streptomyces sp. SID5785]MZD05332.1 SIP domain-containing protein [Streptomyces sp. SID5785]MZD08934.1 SIP domain-containing protein [Streptomyces sp. SID5785]